MIPQRQRFALCRFFMPFLRPTAKKGENITFPPFLCSLSASFSSVSDDARCACGQRQCDQRAAHVGRCRIRTFFLVAVRRLLRIRCFIRIVRCRLVRILWIFIARTREFFLRCIFQRRDRIAQRLLCRIDRSLIGICIRGHALGLAQRFLQGCPAFIRMILRIQRLRVLDRFIQLCLVHRCRFRFSGQRDLKLVQLRRFAIRSGKDEHAITGLCYEQIEFSRVGHTGIVRSGRYRSAFDLAALFAPCQSIGIRTAAIGHHDMIRSDLIRTVMVLDDISLVEGIHELPIACPVTFCDDTRPSVVVAFIIEDL